MACITHTHTHTHTLTHTHTHARMHIHIHTHTRTHTHTHTHIHTHNDYVHRFASARTEPPIDFSQDITSASASLMDGVTTITFNRPRDSGDRNDITLRQDICGFFLFAFSGPVLNFSTGAVGYHGFGPTRRVASAERICIPTFAECSAGNC